MGEHPRAADTVGINVIRMRYFNVIIGGLLAGLAGAYFTLESISSLPTGYDQWLRLHRLSRHDLRQLDAVRSGSAALVFGAAQALQINLQFFRTLIPPQLAVLQNSYVVGLAPYLLTMVILTGLIGKTIPPPADGKPYEK